MGRHGFTEAEIARQQRGPVFKLRRPQRPDAVEHRTARGQLAAHHADRIVGNRRIDRQRDKQHGCGEQARVEHRQPGPKAAEAREHQ